MNNALTTGTSGRKIMTTEHFSWFSGKKYYPNKCLKCIQLMMKQYFHSAAGSTDFTKTSILLTTFDIYKKRAPPPLPPYREIDRVQWACNRVPWQHSEGWHHHHWLKDLNVLGGCEGRADLHHLLPHLHC